MRLTFVSGDQQVDIVVRGGRRALRAATDSALQLLAETPPDEPDEEFQIGFVGPGADKTDAAPAEQ